jgi:hypothetical protein
MIVFLFREPTITHHPGQGNQAHKGFTTDKGLKTLA